MIKLLKRKEHFMNIHKAVKETLDIVNYIIRNRKYSSFLFKKEKELKTLTGYDFTRVNLYSLFRNRNKKIKRGL